MRKTQLKELNRQLQDKLMEVLILQNKIAVATVELAVSQTGRAIDLAERAADQTVQAVNYANKWASMINQLASDLGLDSDESAKLGSIWEKLEGNGVDVCGAGEEEE